MLIRACHSHSHRIIEWEGAYKANPLPNGSMLFKTSITGLEVNVHVEAHTCLLYTSDAADEGLGVDLGGRRIIKN